MTKYVLTKKFLKRKKEMLKSNAQSKNIDYFCLQKHEPQLIVCELETFEL